MIALFPASKRANKSGRTGAANTNAPLTTAMLGAFEMADDCITYAGPPVTLDEAKAAGANRFFTGEPCKHGHIAQRLTICGACVVCKRAWAKTWRVERPDYAIAYRAENLPRLKANRANLYARNMDQAKAEAKAWRRENPERKAAIDAAWRSANPERVAANKAAWQVANPERKSAAQVRWRQNHPEKSRTIVRNRRAKKSQAGGTHTTAETEALLIRQRYRCMNCTASIRKRRHLDHIRPIALEGRNDIRNLQWLCPDCNYKKSAKDPIVWAQEQGRLL